jgi:alpha-1,6-mannosyltransferase
MPPPAEENPAQAGQPLSRRYLVLCLTLWVALVWRLKVGPFGGDFWLHAAAVRELAAHPIQPVHPQLPIDAPSPFFTPWALLTAALARATGADAIVALQVLGAFNLALLLVGLHAFVRSLSTPPVREAPFYALLLVLFCWGAIPWEYSGFLHIGALSYVLPYPSSFALALTLLVLGIRWRRREDAPGGLAAQAVLAAIVLATHPITFATLAAGLAARGLAGDRRPRALAGDAVTIATATALATLWPYFPLWDVLIAQAALFDAGNEEMYEHVIRRTWPILITLPLVLLAPVRTDRRPAVVTLVLLTLGYVAGFVLGRPSLGRVVSSMALVVQSELGVRIAAAEQRVARSMGRAGMLVPAGVLTIGLALSWHPIERTFVRRPAPDPDLSFLSRVTGQYDVILSDLETSQLVPAYGGKVVATGHLVPFVRDLDARQRDVGRFFAPDAGDAERLTILVRHDVDHVLLRKIPGLPWQAVRQAAGAWGRASHEDGSFVLLSRSAARIPSAASRFGGSRGG